MGADQRANGDGAGLPEDPDALEKIIDERRQHLADTVDELVVRAHPKAIARRTTADVKQRAVGLVSDGSGLRYERVAAIATAVVLVVVLVVVRRRRAGGA